MTRFCKVDPMQSRFRIGEKVRFRATKALSDGAPTPGEELIVWTAESYGGSGLTAIVIATDVEVLSFQNRRSVSAQENYVVTGYVVELATADCANSELKQHRNRQDSFPETELSKIGYYQAHLKVKEVSAEAEQFLRGHFN